MSKLKLGVLISGTGSNMKAIVEATEQWLSADVVHVVSSRPDAAGIEFAEAKGIPVTVFCRDDYIDPEEADCRIVDAMQAAGAEYLAMAGYMRKVTPVLLNAFPDRILNLHPALLPAFKGAHAIQDALDAGVEETGVTVHLANENYDEGPIIAQVKVPVLPGDSFDTLAARIHEAEHELYPKVIAAIAEGRMSIDADRTVHIAGAEHGR